LIDDDYCKSNAKKSAIVSVFKNYLSNTLKNRHFGEIFFWAFPGNEPLFPQLNSRAGSRALLYPALLRRDGDIAAAR